MVRLLLRVQAWLKEAYAEVKRIYLELRATILIALLLALIITVIVIFALIVVKKALEEAVEPPRAPGQLPPASEQPVPAIGAPKEVPQPLLLGTGLGPISIVPGPGDESLTVRLSSHSPAQETIRLGFGSLEIEGLPIAGVGEFLSKAVDGIDVALTQLSRLEPPAAIPLLS